MKKAIFFIVLLAGVLPAMAQPDYERQRQDREYKRIAAATERAYNVPSSSSSNSTYKSSSSTSTSSSSSSSNSSTKSNSPGIFVAPFSKYIAPTKTPAEQEEIRKSAIAQKEYEDYQAKEKLWRDNYLKNSNLESDAFTKAAAPTKKILLSAGLTETEATKISETYVRSLTGRYKIEENEATKMFNSYKYKYYYDYNIANGRFDSLYLNLKNLAEFGSSITAQKLLPLLQSRFPDKKTEIDDIQLTIFQKYFENYGPLSANYNGLNKEFIDAYIAFENKNPKIYFAMRDFFDADRRGLPPYKMVYEATNWILECSVCDKQKRKEAKQIKKDFEQREKEILKLAKSQGILDK